MRSLIGLLFAATTASAQTTLPDSVVRRVDAVFARYGALDAPGCALGVYQNGRTVMAKGYGAEYNYSNAGYIALGEIIHRVTGTTLRQYAGARIFAPLGMTVSHFHDDHNEPIRGRAIAYMPAPAGTWRIDVWNNDIVGQGGLM